MDGVVTTEEYYWRSRAQDAEAALEAARCRELSLFALISTAKHKQAVSCDWLSAAEQFIRIPSSVVQAHFSHKAAINRVLDAATAQVSEGTDAAIDALREAVLACHAAYPAG